MQTGRRTRARWIAEGVFVVLALAIVFWMWRADPPWLERHLYGYRCLHAEYGVASLGWRWGAAVAAALLVYGARRLLDRYGFPSLGTVARCSVAVVLSLAVVEVYMRKPWKTKHFAECPFCPPVEHRFPLEWSLAPSQKSMWHAGGRDFFYEIDSEGNRARSVHTVRDHARPTILVAGESIAVAMGLPYEESFSAVLEDRLGIQVVDLAVHAYGLDQIYNRAKEVVPLYQRPIALVTVFVSEEVERGEVEDRPRLRLNDAGELVFVPATPEWIREIQLRTLLQRAFPTHGDEEMRDLRAIVRAIAKLGTDRGAYSLFLATNYIAPCASIGGQEPWIVRSLFVEQGLPHVSVELPKSLQIGFDDYHPGAEGHRRLADAVERALREAHVIERATATP